MGGTMFHKIIPFCVDYIKQNGHINSKISKIIHFSKYFWQILMTYLVIKKSNNFYRNQQVNFRADLGAWFLSKRNNCFCPLSYQEYVSKGITYPVFYVDLVCKLRNVKGETNFISSGSKIVKSLRDRRYDQVIIERSKGFVLAILQPCEDHSLNIALWLTRRLELYHGPCLNILRGTGSWSPFPLILSRYSFSLWTWARVQTLRSTAYFKGCLYIFLIYY